MKIGELARLSGIAASRIRFYEAAGLLRPALRHANGYREYAQESLMRLQIILRAQGAGFSLDEIRSLLPPDLGQWPRDEILQALRRKVDEIEALQRQLAQTRSGLLALIEDIDGPGEHTGGEDCAVRARQVLERIETAEAGPGPAEPSIRRRKRQA